jgi:EAL domain-containing protein (putative c-di-GMP-specific phosphodiesterase class I)
VSLAVNLSPAQFRNRAVVQAVAAALEQTGLAPERLELEITESVLFDESAEALAALEELHRMGIRVALDDFGTGYSSLSYLRRFAFDKIKIDRSFVADLPGAEDSAAIVRAIIGLGRSLKTRVTAEGVETWEQLLMLRAEGCNEAQGYLFSRPLPQAQARRLAETGLVAQPRAAAEQRQHG